MGALDEITMRIATVAPRASRQRGLSLAIFRRELCRVIAEPRDDGPMLPFQTATTAPPQPEAMQALGAMRIDAGATPRLYAPDGFYADAED